MTQLPAVSLVAAELAGTQENAPTSWGGYLARQPILDYRGEVFGYELHGPRPFEQHLEGRLTDDSHGLLDALALFGVKRLAAGCWGFVHCSEAMFTEELLEGLPPEHTVLEIPPVAGDPAMLVRPCRRLKDLGFRLALLDFEEGDARSPLLETIDYVKVDVNRSESHQLEHLRRQLEGGSVTVVADEVHTHQAYRKARSAGIRHLQGFYFCHPELIPNGKIPGNRVCHMEILRQLFKDPLDLTTLCPLVSQDGSLVYRILCFANSPICAVSRPVTSIRAAIMILGDAAFRRLAALAIQSALSRNQSPELLRMALIRAHFCARAAFLCGLDGDEQYLLGMLSLLPPMLSVTMGTILPELPLRTEIREALAGSACKERCLLSWIEAIEDNDISGCDEICETYGLERRRLVELYLNSLEDAASLPRVA